jgi:hypothetical protein
MHPIDRGRSIDIVDTLKTGQDCCEAIRLASDGIEDRDLGADFHLLAETAKSKVVEAARLTEDLRARQRVCCNITDDNNN